MIEYLITLVNEVQVMLYNVTYQSAKLMFVIREVPCFKLTTHVLELAKYLMNDWGNYIVLGIGGTGEGISNRQVYTPLKLGFINE